MWIVSKAAIFSIVPLHFWPSFSWFNPCQIVGCFFFFLQNVHFPGFPFRKEQTMKSRFGKKPFDSKVRVMRSGFYLLYFAICAAFGIGSHPRRNLSSSLWSCDSRTSNCVQSSCGDTWPCSLLMLKGRSAGRSWFGMLWVFFPHHFPNFNVIISRISSWGCCHFEVSKLYNSVVLVSPLLNIHIAFYAFALSSCFEFLCEGSKPKLILVKKKKLF